MAVRRERLTLSGLRARMTRGVGWNFVGACFNQGSTFLVNLVLANLWGLVPFGRYAIVLSTITAIVYVGQLATTYTITRYLAQLRTSNPARAGRLLALCSVVTVAMSLVAAVALLGARSWFAAAVFQDPDLGPALAAGSLIVVPAVMNSFMMGALGGLEAYPALGRAGIAAGTAYVPVCIACAWRFGFQGAIVGVAASAWIQAAILARALVAEARHHSIAFDLRDSWSESRALHRFALPGMLIGVVTIVSVWLANAILVRRPHGYEFMSLFAAANSFRTMVLFVPAIISAVGVSLLNHQQGEGDEPRFRRVFWANLRLTGGIAVTAAVAIVVAGPILLSLFGRDFRDGYPALCVLMVAGVCEVVSLAVGQPLHAQGRAWTLLALVTLPGSAALVLLALVATPPFGAVGLAWCYVAGRAIALAGTIVLLQRIGIWDGRAA